MIVVYKVDRLTHLLANRIYRGEIVHKGVAHPGEHAPIVPRDLWDAVQDKLAARGPGLITKRAPNRSPLTGLLFDGLDRPMTPNHAVKGARRYRYYVTREPSAEQPAWRVSAHDVERIVADRVAELLRDRNRIARLAVAIDPQRVDATATAAAQFATRPILSEASALGIECIKLQEDRLEIVIGERELLRTCGLAAPDDHDSRIRLAAPIERVRRGHELRLIIPGEAPPPKAAERDERLVALLGDAMEARALVLGSPDRSLQQIAADHGRCRKRLARLVRLGWLSPELAESILEGQQPMGITPGRLLETEFPVGWAEQRALLGVA